MSDNVKGKYYGKKAKEKEMKGRIVGTKKLEVGDLIIGGNNKNYYKVSKIIDGYNIKTINLSKGNTDESKFISCLEEGKAYYEFYNYNSKKLGTTEDF